jgi:hypothetical protein
MPPPKTRGRWNAAAAAASTSRRTAHRLLLRIPANDIVFVLATLCFGAALVDLIASPNAHPIHPLLLRLVALGGGVLMLSGLLGLRSSHNRHPRL